MIVDIGYLVSPVSQCLNAWDAGSAKCFPIWRRIWNLICVGHSPVSLYPIWSFADPAQTCLGNFQHCFSLTILLGTKLAK
jgi:hypothetical protein